MRNKLEYQFNRNRPIALMFRVPAIDVNFYPPNRFQVPPGGQPGESDFSDGSGAVFAMYLDRTEEEDIKMAERCKGDADGIHVFVGLRLTSPGHNFALNVENEDRCVLCCRRSVARGDYPRYSTELAGHLGILSCNHFSATFPVEWHSQISILSSLYNPAVSSTAPTWAIWVSGLWFLSLTIGITCAVLATLLQQSARHYLKMAHPLYSPHKRARVRAFYRSGIEELHLPWMVEWLPALLHISQFLFFAGLSVFLFSVNSTIFKTAITWFVSAMRHRICLPHGLTDPTQE